MEMQEHLTYFSWEPFVKDYKQKSSIFSSVLILAISGSNAQDIVSNENTAGLQYLPDITNLPKLQVY